MGQRVLMVQQRSGWEIINRQSRCILMLGQTSRSALSRMSLRRPPFDPPGPELFEICKLQQFDNLTRFPPPQSDTMAVSTTHTLGSSDQAFSLSHCALRFGKLNRRYVHVAVRAAAKPILRNHNLLGLDNHTAEPCHGRSRIPALAQLRSSA